MSPTPVPSRQVSGTVLHADASAVGGVTVRAFHRRVGGEIPLGKHAATDQRGQYTIAYQLPSGLDSVDLFVRASDGDGASLAASPILIGAGGQAVLDLTVRDQKYRGPSEFARATAALAPQVDGAALQDVDADDVALLVRKSGLSRESVTAWVASKRLADRTNVEHESLYGLVRTEGTASMPRLVGRSQPRLLRSLGAAADSNLISLAASDRANATVKRLREAAVEVSASDKTPGSLGALLATATTASPVQQNAFVQRYAEHEGPMPAFWSGLRKDEALGDAVVNDLRLSLQLGTITGNHPPLVKALRANGVTHPSHVARLKEDDWRGLVRSSVDGQTVGVPDGLRGATAAERENAFVGLLTERSARAFPTAHLSNALKAASSWQSSVAVPFLDANPDFDLRTADIASSLKAGTVVRPEWDRSTLEQELSTVQRVMRVAPAGREATVVPGLLANGYTSGLSIVRDSRETFREKTASAFGDEATSDQVHRNAQFQVARATGAYALMHPALGGGQIAALGGISTGVSSNATWASLFGNVDYCRCEECRSIHGPAAYLVDLLAWLDGHQHRGKTAFERLNERRPDIQQIELSCENTNTVLPYVDLVNEILEVRVLNPTGRRANAPEVPNATTGTSPELLANPEYLNPQAYDGHLAKAVFPDILPFDLWGELGRIYFEHLGVRRSDLMEALGRNGEPRRDAIDAERLRLSTAQWRILTGAAQHETWEYWGYDSATPGGIGYRSDLAVVSTFLQRAGIEYEQLLDLLHSRFVNPRGNLNVTGADCNTDGMRVVPLTDDVLVRTSLFLRLWRNRGWTLFDLDKVLHALRITRLDAAGLGRLADLDRVLELTRAPLLEVLSWWSPVDTFADRPEKDRPVPSLYDRVFRNRAVDPEAESPAFPFALDTARMALANVVNWDDVRSLLQAALSIDADQLSPLLDETVDGVPNDQRVVTGTAVTLDGLSALYRHVTLARRLRLTIDELLGLLRLVGRVPFDVADTDALVEFVETARDVRASGLSLIELHYLLEHDAASESSVGITDEAIGQTLAGIRDGLTRVASDYAVAADPAGELTARYLSVVLDADAVAEVMTALRTEATRSNRTGLEATLTGHLAGLFAFDASALVLLNIEARFEAVVARLVPYLQETQGNALIIEKAAAFVERGLDSAQDLLSRLQMTVNGNDRPALGALRQSPYTTTTASEIVPADDPEAFGALRRIHKAALVLNTIEFDMDAQAWLFDVGVRNGLLNPLSLPIVAQPTAAGAWSGWTELVDLAALAKDLPGGEPTLVELLQLLESADAPAAAEDAFLAALSARTAWLRADVDTLVGAFAPVFPRGWRDGRMLRTLVDVFALIGRLGVSAAQADAWVIGGIGAAQAEELRLAAKAKHDEDRWPAIARALRDPVREKQRAALVAYLVATVDGYDDETDLFDDLLIDVEMAPCMLTSRIKQAISSVQLFVQRAFLNLETGISLTRDDREQWEWMKNYRVWEAARKVFLYPENWIEPELRPTKSPLFEQLENALLQGELDDVAAERAYTAYLEGLLAIARMEVMGVYHEFEEDDDGTVDVLHVVARTKAHPHAYYYRQWIDAREWTPWEKLDVEIEGDHIILAVHERRLLLLWPVVVQKAEGDETSKAYFCEMRLAWIERLHEEWGARQLSKEAITIHGQWAQFDPTGIASHVVSAGEWLTYFRLGSGPRLVIECWQAFAAAFGANLLGRFIMDPCTGDFVATSLEINTGELITSSDSIVQRMRFVLATGFEKTVSDTPFSLMTGTEDVQGNLVGDPREIEVLGTVPARGFGSAGITGDGKVPGGAFGSHLYPHQYKNFLSQHGVFLDDDERTFHVMPRQGIGIGKVALEDTFDPSDLGTREWKPTAFEPRQADTRFESEILWDATPVLEERLEPGAPGSGETRLSLRPRPVPDSSARRTIAESADVLTADALQASHLQLTEATQRFDPLIAARSTRYRFSLFCHPYVCDFLSAVRRSGVEGLLDPNPRGPSAGLVRQKKSRPDLFETTYAPTSSVLEPYPIHDIDFEPEGAYSLYNWELFFHAPLLVATCLSREQRFEDARRWFHFMFDPTNRTDDEDPLRFWKIKPFYRLPDAPIEEFLALAASTDGSPEAAEARAGYDRQIEAWLEDPFNPHAVAQLRTTAYQKALVMKYLDNLIAWGDRLFRQDTIESINEATQLYVLALQLLGERPDALPPRAEPANTTFEQVRRDLADSVLNNPLVQLENRTFPPSTSGSSVSALTTNVNSWATVLQGFYFCIPPNPTLLVYWDTVEDRLFKIRHCMNIEGVVRQLPLFEPPIDPGMLVRARAAGVDLSSALADLSAPLPHYRFAAMLQKTYALNQTVRGLGAALLSALEKVDAEALTLLRANQEVTLLEAVRQVKTLAIDEARQSLTAAERSLTVLEQRRDYYKGLIDAGWLAEEKEQVALLGLAAAKELGAATVSAIGALLTFVPRVSVGTSGVAASPVAVSDVVDGKKLAKRQQMAAMALESAAAASSTGASILGVTSGWRRRADEWTQQRELANREIKQVQAQIEAAKVRVALAERDLENHDRQIQNARSVREFMEQKFTSVELYHWTVGQLSSLYFQSYQLAYDLAKQTERAYRHELAQPGATFIRFGYWDSLKKGLLSGESLQHDLERMDKAYLENNLREYEITRHVSLALLDPLALVQLQTSGGCDFSIPESLFDLDYAGQYLRRIRSVSVTVPCVTGPYTGVPMRLTLVSSRTRVDPSATGDYPMDTSADDLRFQIQTGSVQSIAVSGGRDDTGLFGPDLRDERYLPFEGTGAISNWNLTLTSAVPTFAWTTITDVVLHVRYTAREGGELLRSAALASLNAELASLPLRRAFSARSEFPSEWNAFLRPTDANPQAVLSVNLAESLFPYIAHGAGLKITGLEVVAVLKEPTSWQATDVTVTTAQSSQTVTLAGSPAQYGGLPSASVPYAGGAAPGTWTLSLPVSQVGIPADWADDIVLIASYELDLELG